MKLPDLSGKVICMGSINIDMVMFTPHFPAVGETVMTDNFHKTYGGKGSNQAVAASRMGADVQFLGKLSDDDHSAELWSALEANGVDMSLMYREAGSTAGVALIFVNPDGDNMITCTTGANGLLTPGEVTRKAHCFTPGSILLTTLETGVQTVLQSLKEAKSRGAFTVLDPAPISAEMDIASMAEYVDIIKPNEVEASIITGIEVTDPQSAGQAAKKLAEMGFKLPIVTLGAQGCVMLEEGALRVFPGHRRATVDATAAGDTFIGGLVARLSRGETIEEALAFAMKAAAICVSAPGAQNSIPFLETVLSSEY